MRQVHKDLANLRHAVMSKEIGDDGWDLRDELLELIQIVGDVMDAVESAEDAAAECRQQEPTR